MTGHVGERVNRHVALMTEDFRLYHDLAPYFGARGITLLGVRPGEEVPPSVRVLLGGPKGDPRSIPILEDPDAIYLSVLAALDPRRRLHVPYKLVRVGVDPGETIGLALLADGAVFIVAQAFSPRDAEARVLAWLDGVKAHATSIQVGDGSPTHTAQLVEVMRRIKGAVVSIVPEDDSTPTTPVTDSRHTDAAIHIAMRDP